MNNNNRFSVCVNTSGPQYKWSSFLWPISLSIELSVTPWESLHLFSTQETQCWESEEINGRHHAMTPAVRSQPSTSIAVTTYQKMHTTNDTNNTQHKITITLNTFLTHFKWAPMGHYSPHITSISFALWEFPCSRSWNVYKWTTVFANNWTLINTYLDLCGCLCCVHLFIM